MDKEKHLSIPTITSIKESWDNLSDIYADIDGGMNNYYFTLANLMDIGNANNILDVGCGRCLLLPHVLNAKPEKCSYLATDLSPHMIQLAHEYLRSYFSRYESKLSYE